MISNIVIYLKGRKEGSFRAFIEHLLGKNKNNLNLKTSYFQHEKTDVGDFYPTYDLKIMDINFISRSHDLCIGFDLWRHLSSFKASKPVLKITILKMSYFSSWFNFFFYLLRNILLIFKFCLWWFMKSFNI